MTGRTVAAALCVLAALVAGCGGTGVVIADGGSCRDWLHGNGRDAYLQAHGLKEYDAGVTGRWQQTTAVANAMTAFCSDDHDLRIDEAFRLAAARVAGQAAAAPPAGPGRAGGGAR